MLSKAQIQLTQRLQQKKFRLSESLFLVEGTKIVAELLNTQHPIYCIYAQLDLFLRKRFDRH